MHLSRVIGRNGVGVSAQSVVDRGLIHCETEFRFRGNPANEPRHGLIAALARGDHHGSVAMRVGQMVIDPVAGARRQLAVVQFPRRQKHLLVDVVDVITGHVHTGKLVISSQLLELLEDVLEIFPIPDGDVAQFRLNSRAVDVRHDHGRREFSGLDVVQLERREGRLDVPLDVGTLPVDFVGFHDVFLHELGEKGGMAQPQGH